MPALRSIVLSTALILAFSFLRHYILKSLPERRYTSPDATAFSQIKLAGVLLFGIIPWAALYYTDADMMNVGLSSCDSASFWYLFILIPMLIVALQIFLPTSKEVLGRYPDLSPVQWSGGSVLLLLMGWLLYTAAYELLFSGVLFFSCYREYGLAAGVIINIAFYSLAHIPKGMQETLGAIPFGLLLCFISYLTGSVYMAFVVHVTLALSTQVVTLRRRGLLGQRGSA